MLLQVAGMGAERAVRAAESLLAAGAQALVSLGVAAALQPALRCGTLLLPTRVVNEAGNTWVPEPAWHARWCALAAGMPVDEGVLLETRAPLVDSAQKRRLGAEHAAVAADMESAALLATAHAAGVPGMVVRVVLDEMRQALPVAALAAVTPAGSPCWAGLLRALARRPHELRTLVLLGVSQRRALASLRVLLARARPLPRPAAAGESRAGCGHNPRRSSALADPDPSPQGGSPR